METGITMTYFFKRNQDETQRRLERLDAEVTLLTVKAGEEHDPYNYTLFMGMLQDKVKQRDAVKGELAILEERSAAIEARKVRA